MHATGGDGHFAFTSNPSTAIFIDSVASNVTAGSYLVTASDGMACTQSTTVDVADIPGPDPCFIFASTDNVNMIINNCTQGANNEYFWDFGDGVTSTETHPIHEYMEPGLYSVSMIVTDEFNCVDSLRQDYRINGPVYIANAFSPNGDGINDEIFVIGKSIQQEDFFWAIYDRHGSLVFLSVSPSIGWDGTILGGRDAQPGVYVYRLKYKDVNGSLFEKDGNITLIR
jgi:gliding motility-associated-like protein